MSNTRQKLIGAAVLLVLSVTILIGASLAWFTISTNPEITGITVTLNTDLALLICDSECGTYDDSLYVDDIFDYLVGLRPVSTADGIHWFFPTYEQDGVWLDALGAIEDFFHWEETQQQMDGNETYGNVVGVTLNKDGTIYYDEDDNVVWLTGKDLSAAEAEAGYAYFDVWLMTEEEEVDVRLSVPSTNTQESWEFDEAIYGSYVLANYQIETTTETVEGEEVTSATATLESAAQTAIRVGFMTFEYIEDIDVARDDSGDIIYDDEGNPETTSTWVDTGEPTNFVIYEPNADQRSSSWDEKPNEYESQYEAELDGTVTDIYGEITDDNLVAYSEYIKEYAIRADGANYQDDQYIPTYYVAWDPTATVEQEVTDEEDESETLEDETPEDETPEDETLEDETLEDEEEPTGAPYLTALSGEQLIVQKESTWDDGALQAAIALQADNLTNGSWLQDLFSLSSFLDAYDDEDFGYSNYVDTLGLFIADYESLVTEDNELTIEEDDDAKTITDLGVYDISDTQNESTTGEAIIVTLYKDQPQRVRIYIWLEGQDVDCWNDIAASSFVVNLELAAEVITPEEETEGET